MRAFTTKTQHEEQQYQEGRRDGYAGLPMPHDASPAYRAGYRAGILESAIAC